MRCYPPFFVFVKGSPFKLAFLCVSLFYLPQVLEFVDHHGNEVLSLGSFALLPEHVVRLILSREELKADELTKFQAALHWSQRYCDHAPASTDLRDVIANFYECIEFYKIPATVLMREVHPLGVVPDHMMMNALAFQVKYLFKHLKPFG